VSQFYVNVTVTMIKNKIGSHTLMVHYLYDQLNSALFVQSLYVLVIRWHKYSYATDNCHIEPLCPNIA